MRGNQSAADCIPGGQGECEFARAERQSDEEARRTRTFPYDAPEWDFLYDATNPDAHADAVAQNSPAYKTEEGDPHAAVWQN